MEGLGCANIVLCEISPLFDAVTVLYYNNIQFSQVFSLFHICSVSLCSPLTSSIWPHSTRRMLLWRSE